MPKDVHVYHCCEHDTERQTLRVNARLAMHPACTTPLSHPAESALLRAESRSGPGVCNVDKPPPIRETNLGSYEPKPERTAEDYPLLGIDLN